MKKILAFLLTLSLAFVLLGCEKDVKPTSVEITGAKDMLVGETLKLTATVKPDDATDKTVKWSSDNAEVATVDQGTVKAVKEGTVKITAKATADESVQNTVTINVTKKAETAEPTEIKVSGVADVKVGSTITLTVEVVPAAADQSVTFETSDEAIAKVDAKGVVTGVKAGTVEITVASKAKAEVKKVVTINVVEEGTVVLPTSVEIKGEASVEVGKTITLTAEVLPADASQNVEWSSSDETILTVDANGVVTGVKAGEAVVTAVSKADGNIKGELTVKVTEEELPGKPEYIQLLGYRKHLPINTEMQIRYQLFSNKEEVTLDEIEWSVSDEGATISEDGIFVATKAGKYTVKCTSKADKNVVSSITVEVTDTENTEYKYEIEDFEVTFTKTEFLRHESIVSNIKTTYSPSSLDNQDIFWISSDTSVVKISATYRTPYIVGEGEVTLTAVSALDPSITHDYQIKVNPYVAPTSFKVVDNDGEVTAIELIEGRYKTLSIAVEPENADPNATFTSLNEEIATVDAKGQIHALVPGETFIVVKSTYEGADFEKQIKITVTKKQEVVIKVDQVTVEVEKKVFVGYKLKAKATIYPINAPQGVTWEIHKSGASLATIDSDGMIVAIATGSIKIRAISTFDPTKKSSWTAIEIQKAPEPLPIGDLKGYEIIIMNADSALSDNDPFYHEEINGVVKEYTQADKQYKQRAWKEVQDKYNCTISVKAYPVDAPWGAKRISWIIDNATNGTSQCDLGIVPTNWIPQFGAANAAVDVSELYDKYGLGQMEPALKTAGTYKGKLFIASTGISQTSTYVNLGLFYNYGWIKELGVEDPATMFNEGNWTYTKFKEWVMSTQSKLKEDEHVLQGSPYYYWFGMSNAAGIQVCDPNMATGTIDDDKQVEASAVIADLAKNDCILKPQTWAEQSESEFSFHKGKTLMTTGDIWFVRNLNRWPSDMWGEGKTEYGYVPFPYPDNMDKEDTKISVASYSAYMYIAGRQYPAELGKEAYKRIWGVMNEMFINTIAYQEAEVGFDPKQVIRDSLMSRLDNPASIEAVIFYDAKKVLFDPAHGIYSSVSATPLKSAANNVMYEGKDYYEEFEKVRESFENEIKKFYAA